ncbi:hypothetical protein K4H02_22430, partial [Mycobacterium tuberculosis]|nr:hypothetical protein [Mycobacterium tuberculosis]
RRARAAALLDALAAGPASIPDLVARVYPDLPSHLAPAAGLSTLAQLEAFVDAGRVAPDGFVTLDAVFRRSG